MALVVQSAVAVAQPADGNNEGSGAPAPAPETKPEPAAAPAAPTNIGTIEGTVEAPDLDAPLAGATVTIVGTDVSAKTDDDGHFTLQAAPGVIHVRADFTGFRSEERVVNVPAACDREARLRAERPRRCSTRRSSSSVRARRARTSRPRCRST